MRRWLVFVLAIVLTVPARSAQADAYRCGARAEVVGELRRLGFRREATALAEGGKGIIEIFVSREKKRKWQLLFTTSVRIPTARRAARLEISCRMVRGTLWVPEP